MRRLRALAASAAVVAAVSVGGLSGTAYATGDVLNCSDFETPVKIVNGYDPNNLDRDQDGIGCEDNSGDAIAYDRYSDLKSEGDTAPKPTLAKTGAGDLIHKHPVRSMGAAGLLVVAGAGGMVLARRRKEADR